MNGIDLLAIIPFYLEQILLAVMRGQGGADLGPFAVLRVIRLTRVVRVLKASKTMRGLTLTLTLTQTLTQTQTLTR